MYPVALVGVSNIGGYIGFVGTIFLAVVQFETWVFLREPDTCQLIDHPSYFDREHSEAKGTSKPILGGSDIPSTSLRLRGCECM